MATDNNNDIYVCDTFANVINKISGGNMSAIVSVTFPNGLAVDNLGNVTFTW